MSKGSTNIQGIYPLWRPNVSFDALRISLKAPDKEQFIVSAKLYPPLLMINKILKEKKLRRHNGLQDPDVKRFYDQLCQDLKKDYALSYLKILEKIDLKKKSFDFEESLDQFELYKTRHSISHAYRRFLQMFWLPFFLNKCSCQHPRDFINFHSQAEFHLRTSKTKAGVLYSPAAYNNKTTPFNEYMRFLLKQRIIRQEHFFTLDHKLTLEERKRQVHVPVRTTDTYTIDELKKIKAKIDIHYAGTDGLKWKLRAYGILLGSFCLGLRVGNILGMPVENLKPDDDVPHAMLKDNVVGGWSRGLKGDLVIQNATKTSHNESIKVPFILPDRQFCVQLAKFLKAHLKPQDRVLSCSTNYPSRWWKKIAKKCGFKYIHPHGGKHGFATIGSANLHLFNNNPYLLQYCCLHRDFRTTQRYINQKSDEVLKQFKLSAD